MNTSVNKYDAIEKLIHEEGIRIETIDVRPESDTMLIILNTKAILHQRLCSYKNLKSAKKDVLLQYELNRQRYWHTLAFVRRGPQP
ncbi:MAG: hypothetical protein WDO71_24245 [Bacteroidota bacterium]